MPIVWAYSRDRVGDTIGDWSIEDSTFIVMSSYWALNPNGLFGIHPDARRCVDSNDRWILVAESPGLGSENLRWPPEPGGHEPTRVDETLWRRVTANPWRLTTQGPVGEPGDAPHYAGVARFTDETIVTSAACDTRINLVQFIGDTLTPSEWPVSSATMICAPPPGIEPLPHPERASEWYLPIGGVLEFDGDDLLITYDGRQYRYEAISDEEFASEFNRNSFTTVPDPLNPLDEYVMDSFRVHDNPGPPPAGGPSAPSLSVEESAELRIRAFTRLCESVSCTGAPIYASSTMPEHVQAGLAAIYDGITFVSDNDLVDVIYGGADTLPNGAVFLWVGGVDPTEQPTVVGIDAWYERSRFEGRGNTILFDWSDGRWVDTSSEASGVTVTTSVP